MRLTFWAAGACAVVIGVMAYAAPPAEAAQKKKIATAERSETVGARRPRTRITVQRRSFLDGGTEVLPGERKFMDYAFPPGEQGAPLSAVQNTAFDRRSSLPGPFELPSRRNPWPWNWCVGC